MKVRDKNIKKTVSVADSRCLKCSCYWPRPDPGSFVQGQGYRRREVPQGWLCGTREIGGCPTRARCCNRASAEHETECAECGQSLAGEKEMEAMATLAHRHHMPPVELIRDAAGGWESYESEQRRRVKRRMEWSAYPLGTEAPAIGGGSWTRVEHGWKWGSLTGGGGVFPTPGGDNDGTVIMPHAEL